MFQTSRTGDWSENVLRIVRDSQQRVLISAWGNREVTGPYAMRIFPPSFRQMHEHIIRLLVSTTELGLTRTDARIGSGSVSCRLGDSDASELCGMTIAPARRGWSERTEIAPKRL